MEPATLKVANHILSAPRESDIDRISTLCQDPDIQRWTTVPVPYERHHAESFVRDFVSGGWSRGSDCVWAIRADLDGDVLGMVGLHGIADGSATVGYWLAPQARGQGLATAALTTVAEFAFGPLGLTRLAWDAVVGNEASRRVAQRAGFRIEGQVRGWYFTRGVREDAWLGTRYPTDRIPG